MIKCEGGEGRAKPAQTAPYFHTGQEVLQVTTRFCIVHSGTQMPSVITVATSTTVSDLEHLTSLGLQFLPYFPNVIVSQVKMNIGRVDDWKFHML